MRRISIAALTLILLLAGQAMAARVTDVELSYENGLTVATIKVDGPVRFTHETEVPKNGRPDRVIVDILSATHELSAKEYHDLPLCVVKAIRSSQFAVTPEKIVRVVFDMTEAPIYRIDSDGSAIKLTFDNKNTKAFATWSSSPKAMTASARPVPATVKKTPKATSTTQVAQQNKAIEKDRMSSLSSPGSKSKKTTASGSEPEPHSAFGKFSEPQGTVASAPAAKRSSADKTTPVAKPAVKKAVKKSDSLTETKAGEASSKKATPQPAVKSKTKAKPVPSPVPKSKTRKSEGTLADSKTSTQAPKKAPVKSSSAKGQKALAAKVSGSSPAASQPKPKASEPSPKKTASKTQVAAKTATKPSASANRSTSRFRRRAASAKIKGTMVAEFPKRLVVKYKSGGRRDPFASLIDETRHYNSPVEQQVPNIEGLKLVGIIESGEGANRALFEDNTGYSYMLKSGDKVRNGYVLRVEAEQVFFQIFEYGWSRTVALGME